MIDIVFCNEVAADAYLHGATGGLEKESGNGMIYCYHLLDGHDLLTKVHNSSIIESE